MSFLMYGYFVITNEFGHDMSGTKNLPLQIFFLWALSLL